jgi:hypothetical protein
MRYSFIALLLAATSLRAQQGGTITGVVRDSAARPIADATVTLKPSNRTAQTDSAGRFKFENVGADSYSARARKLGYRPENWDVKLAKDGHADLKFELAIVPQFLDTVRVNADGSCPATRSFESFLCRRQRPGGVYLDYDEIDEKGIVNVAELFKDIRGFHVIPHFTPAGMAYTLRSVRGDCIRSIVDGREVTTLGAAMIPRLTMELIALEVYARPDSAPKELQRYTRPEPGAGSGRCSLVVYWTNRSPYGPNRIP